MEKRNCPIHKDEEIFNFCSVEGCFVELCASCIGKHTDKHLKEGTKPNYQSIKKIISVTSDRLSDYQKEINNYKGRTQNIISGIQQKKKDVKLVFQLAKDDCCKLIERTFDQMQEAFFKQLKMEKNKTGLHNMKKLDSICHQLQQHSFEINNLIKQLNYTKSMNLTHQINRDFILRGNAFKNAIDMELSDNQNFRSDVMYDSNKIWEIQTNLKQLITSSFTVPSINRSDFYPDFRASRIQQSHGHQIFRPIMQIRNISPRKVVRENIVSPIKIVRDDRVSPLKIIRDQVVPIKILRENKSRQSLQVEDWKSSRRSPLKNVNYYTTTL